MKSIIELNRKKARPGNMELIIWITLAIIISLPELVYIIDRGDIEYFLLQGYNKMLISIFIIIFPFLFKLIFGTLPFEFIRNKRINPNNNIDKSYSEIEIRKKKDTYSKPQNEDFYLDYIKEDQDISDKIYGRSGAYLLFGCLIAFSGILSFSILGQTTSSNQDSASITLRLLSYLPRFGTLFFLEFIAFFFFKQHRIMMEEFRYYERIKRRREDNYSILKIIEKYEEKEKTLSIILENYLFEDANNKISKEETTEILETQKITNSETIIFEKILDLVQAIKK